MTQPVGLLWFEDKSGMIKNSTVVKAICCSDAKFQGSGHNWQSAILTLLLKSLLIVKNRSLSIHMESGKPPRIFKFSFTIGPNWSTFLYPHISTHSISLGDTWGWVNSQRNEVSFYLLQCNSREYCWSSPFLACRSPSSVPSRGSEGERCEGLNRDICRDTKVVILFYCHQHWPFHPDYQIEQIVYNFSPSSFCMSDQMFIYRLAWNPLYLPHVAHR